ncbi:MAG: ABC transporter substrate-binding protein, partial [Candidatus Bipolaricaulota bacterium]
RSPQDLEGKSLAATTGVNDPILSLLPALMQMNDADFSKVQVIQVASQAKEGLVLTERVDAMTGSITAQPPAFEAQGHDIEVLSFSDWGVNPISNVLVTHNTLLQEDPQLVRSFLKATARSIEASLENPGDALTALKKAYPETDTQVARLQLQWFFKLIQSEQAQAVFGYHDRGAWEELQALQIQYLGLRERWDVSQYFTNDFLPG